MHIAVAEAGTQLSALVQRAEAGDEVVLTRDGRAAVRLVPVEQKAAKTPEERRAGIERAVALARKTAIKGPDYPGAARSQDFLYDEDGLPA